MDRRIVTALILLAVAVAAPKAAYAQENPSYETKWSVELGTGVQPLIAGMLPSRQAVRHLADQGMSISTSDAFYPVLSLSAVARTGLKTELTLTVGSTWAHAKATSYPVFGTDPSGKPRYDAMGPGTPAGWKDISPAFSLNFNYRHLWNPQNMVTFYSGAGLGLSTVTAFTPIPTLTPIAMQIGAGHFYGFVEGTIGLVATYVHGGLGWRF